MPLALRLKAEYDDARWHVTGLALAQIARTKAERIEYERRFGELPDLSTPEAQQDQCESVRGVVAKFARTIEGILASLPASNAATLDAAEAENEICHTRVGSGDGKSLGRKVKKLRWLAEAMALVQEYPDWSDARIAKEVGRSPSTLSKNATYQKAAATARVTAPPPKGYKRYDLYTGACSVEAEDPEPE